MHYIDYLNAIFLGIIEGVTEFLPISSTGHLILAEKYLPIGSEEFAKAFSIIIQLPAICSVILYFWSDLWPDWNDVKKLADTFRLWIKILIAFIPAAIIGFLFDKHIERLLFNPITIALALFIGGIVLMILEYWRFTPKYTNVEEVSNKTALTIGFFQCIAMIPGTSRSAATIIGAMTLGADRSTAALFSFYLAIPTMVGATGYKVVKNGIHFNEHEWLLLLVGSLVSFFTAWAVIAVFMRYIRTHNFIPFAWYRIALGITVLVFHWV